MQQAAPATQQAAPAAKAGTVVANNATAETAFRILDFMETSQIESGTSVFSATERADRRAPDAVHRGFADRWGAVAGRRLARDGQPTGACQGHRHRSGRASGAGRAGRRHGLHHAAGLGFVAAAHHRCRRCRGRLPQQRQGPQGPQPLAWSVQHGASVGRQAAPQPAESPAWFCALMGWRIWPAGHSQARRRFVRC